MIPAWVYAVQLREGVGIKSLFFFTTAQAARDRISYLIEEDKNLEHRLFAEQFPLFSGASVT